MHWEKKTRFYFLVWLRGWAPVDSQAWSLTLGMVRDSTSRRKSQNSDMQSNRNSIASFLNSVPLTRDELHCDFHQFLSYSNDSTWMYSMHEACCFKDCSYLSTKLAVMKTGALPCTWIYLNCIRTLLRGRGVHYPKFPMAFMTPESNFCMKNICCINTFPR